MIPICLLTSLAGFAIGVALADVLGYRAHGLPIAGAGAVLALEAAIRIFADEG